MVKTQKDEKKFVNFLEMDNPQPSAKNHLMIYACSSETKWKLAFFLKKKIA